MLCEPWPSGMADALGPLKGKMRQLALGCMQGFGDLSSCNQRRAHADIFCMLLQSGFGLVMWWKRKGTSASQSSTPAAW